MTQQYTKNIFTKDLKYQPSNISFGLSLSDYLLYVDLYKCTISGVLH